MPISTFIIGQFAGFHYRKLFILYFLLFLGLFLSIFLFNVYFNYYSVLTSSYFDIHCTIEDFFCCKRYSTEVNKKSSLTCFSLFIKLTFIPPIPLFVWTRPSIDLFILFYHISFFLNIHEVFFVFLTTNRVFPTWKTK